MRGDDAAKILHDSGDSKRTKRSVLQVSGQPAAHADVVVVLVRVGVEAHALATRAQSSDESELGKKPQGSVDGVERSRGHPGLNSPEDHLCVGVINAPRDLAEDLQPLVGELHARLPACRLEPIQSPIDLGLRYLHVYFRCVRLRGRNLLTSRR